MSAYADKLTAGLEKQFGAEWWLMGAYPHHLQDYARATTDADRKRIRQSIEAQTRQLAHSMIQAGILGGIVEDAPPAALIQGRRIT